MGRKQEYDWLNDPFDEAKQAADLERARRSRGLGCVLAAVVLVAAVAFLAFVVLGAVGFAAA